MFRSRTFSLAVVISLALSQASSSAEGAQWQAPLNNFQVPPVGLNIVDSFFNTGESISRLEVVDPSFVGTNYERRLCTQMGEAPCDGSLSNPQYSLSEVLPPCSNLISEWCIEGLSIYNSASPTSSEAATLIRSTDAPILNKNTSLGIPQGGAISLWRVPNQINSGNKDTYAVYLYIVGGGNKNSEMNINELRAMVLPYSEKAGNYRKGSVSTFDGSLGKKLIGVSGGQPECAWTEDGVCGFIEDFPQDSKVKLRIRVGNRLSGWMMGRMADPKIQVSKISATQNLLEIDSEPITVPKFYVSIPKDKITPEISAIDPAIKDGVPSIHNQLASQTEFKLASAWAKFTEDKAAGRYSTWSLTSTLNGRGSRCLSDTTKLLGFVTTNSALYEGNAPNFSDGALTYNVWSQHYLEDGSVFKGKYDLIMRSEVARCLYGFSNAPVSASISITSTDGTAQVATTTLNEHDGWLHLGANGFTFSSPTIRVILQQTKDSATLKTITCVKGTIKKVVKAVNPKCPVGYKTKL